MPERILRGNIILPHRLLERSLLVIEDGIISGIRESDTACGPVEDFAGHFIAPGFIDVHVHGIAGADAMDDGEDSFSVMAKNLAAHGVTGFLPTTVTGSRDQIARAIDKTYLYMQRQRKEEAEAEVLGIHLEGPWISRQYKGAQDEKYIIPPTVKSANDILQAPGLQAVKIVSLAPELDGADEVIRVLCQSGIHVSIGHTGATYEQALNAVALGATQITHCFNAMSGLHHRRPGVAGAALFLDRVYAELIADGIHVHPEVMRLLIQSKGRERVMLVSDAIAPAGLPDGSYWFGEQKVSLQGGQARLEDGTLAGSVITLDQAVRNLVSMCGISIQDAVYMAASTPAEAIGLGQRKGKICAGFDADLVILDDCFRPVQVIMGGKNRRAPSNEYLDVDRTQLK